MLLRNQGGQGPKGVGSFTNITSQGGPYFQTEHQGRGIAVGNLDNDGRPDLVISHLNEPITLLRNEAGQGHHWLGVELADKGHRDFVGAKVTLHVGGRTLTRFAKGGGSYLSSGDRRLLFGLGQAERAGRLTVVWPFGQEQHWEGLAVERYWRLTAGDPKPQEIGSPSKKCVRIQLLAEPTVPRPGGPRTLAP